MQPPNGWTYLGAEIRDGIMSPYILVRDSITDEIKEQWGGVSLINCRPPSIQRFRKVTKGVKEGDMEKAATKRSSSWCKAPTVLDVRK
jgi:hypothetical protein